MSDLSTREEIRAVAMSRIARSLFDFEARPLTPDPGDWEGLTPTMRDRYRRRAVAAVDALGDLLPTGEAWGVGVVEDHTGDRVRLVPHDIHEYEDEAREDAAIDGEPVMRAYTHDWIEVTE